MKLETIAVHVGRTIESATGEVAPAIHMSTTYERDVDGEFSRGYSYVRPDNPGRKALEQCIAALEDGEDAIAFASGSAASLAVFSLLRPGEHVVAPIEVYHGTGKQLRDIVSPMGVRCSFVDMTSVDAVRAVLGPDTRLVWIETPSNPLMRILDISAIAEIARSAGAQLLVDNTFASPILQRPLALGADVVLHSTTKYCGGHSDVLGGCLVVKSRELFDKLFHVREILGAVASPFNSWLILRGLRSLPCRMDRHSANAAAVAAALSACPGVEAVYYPGLPSHPGHEIARRQMKSFGGMLSFLVRGGRADALRVASRVRLFVNATSLGGVESLIEHRASSEGKASNAPDNLLRLSIGLEHPDDLIEDLLQALS